MTQHIAPSPSPPVLFRQLRSDIQPGALLSSLPAGLITGVIGTIRAISYASLIFSGPLATFLPTGLGMALFSTAVTAAVAALTSALPGIIATPLAAPTAILAIMAGGIAQELSGDAPDAELLATVLVAIALTSLLTGLLLLGLGIFKQGERIRVVPYPVIGGFMAGTGWLLVKGFLQVTTDRPLTIETLTVLFQPEVAQCWLPGLGFALVLLTMTRRFKQSWILPVTLLGCTGLFYLGLWVTQTPLGVARDSGLLLGPFPKTSSGLWQPLTPNIVTGVHWGAIAHQGGSMLTVAFISLLSLMLSNSSIEVVVGRDLNLSPEMRAIGLSNMVSGLGGGMVGNQALPSTLLVHNMGAPHRLTGIFSTLPAIAVLVLGSAFLAYLPKAILGCLLLYLGLSLLLRWIYDAYFQLPLLDYLSVWVTVVVIDAVGFLQGIAAGFVLIVVGFMYQYSQVDVAKQVTSGTSIHSNLDRDPQQQRLLSAVGGQVYVLELQGFLFFGTANYLLSKVRDRIQKTSKPQPASDGSAPDAGDNPPPLRYVLVDFRQVRGIDSSAVLTFSKILRLAQKQPFTLVLTNLNDIFEAKLQQGEGFDRELDCCKVFPDIDRGLEWCEEQLLTTAVSTSDLASERQKPSVQELLTQLFLSSQQAERFMSYLEPQSLPPCHYIFRRGEASPDLYFIESGQVSVLLETGDGYPKRLQTCFSGNMLGEMRFFGKVPLSTSVVTDKPSQLYRLTQSAFSRMEDSDPDLAQALQTHIVGILCNSLIRREEQLRIIQ